jgi:hypothetical protein
MNRLPRWFLAATVMIVMADGTVGGMTGGAQARPRCTGLMTIVNQDYSKANYWAALTTSAADDGAWDEYKYYTGLYAFWIQQATADIQIPRKRIASEDYRSTGKSPAVVGRGKSLGGRS